MKPRALPPSAHAACLQAALANAHQFLHLNTKMGVKGLLRRKFGRLMLQLPEAGETATVETANHMLLNSYQVALNKLDQQQSTTVIKTDSGVQLRPGYPWQQCGFAPTAGEALPVCLQIDPEARLP